MLSMASLFWPDWNPEALPVDESQTFSQDDLRSGRVQLGDPALIRYLDATPDALKSFTSRQFEQFVGDLLSRSGYEVKLGRKGRDGGVDAMAWRDGELGPELTVVQCKRYTEEKVGEPIVKQLYADVQLRNATRGLLVTTSFFSSDALKLIEANKYRLVGRNFDDVVAWMKKVFAL